MRLHGRGQGACTDPAQKIWTRGFLQLFVEIISLDWGQVTKTWGEGGEPTM